MIKDNDNSFLQEAILSQQEKEAEETIRADQLKNIFKLLEDNDKSFVECQENQENSFMEDEEEYRFRILEEDGTYSQMSLDNVFKNQIRLYGL